MTRLVDEIARGMSLAALSLPMDIAVTTPSKQFAIPAIERRCTQCGEKLVAQLKPVALPLPRTSVELCTDCGVHDLPHTD